MKFPLRTPDKYQDMTFKIDLSPNIPRARLTNSNPLQLLRFDRGGRDGVLAMVQQGTERQAYFYPRPAIEEHIAAQGGREKYVYSEGFDSVKVIDSLAPLIKAELPTWQPHLNGPMKIEREKLGIGQPGINKWRLLCFVLDHGPDPCHPESAYKFISQVPPIFSVWTAAYGPALYAGNHRLVYEAMLGFSCLDMTWIHVPSRAVRFNAAIRFNLNNVEDTFGCQGYLALIRSFIRQVEEEVKR